MPHAGNPARSAPENRLLVRALQVANICFARIYHRLEVRAPCQLPRSGAAILVCNHTSGLDPALVQAACPRLIVWMMTREYYDKPALQRFFKFLEVIPVERGGRDPAAIRRAMRALQQGRVLGVFPEGRIERTKELLPFQNGVAMMAMRSGAAVYPAYLTGTQRHAGTMLRAYLRPQKAGIAFGPPLKFDPLGHTSANVDATLDAIRQAVQRLRQAHFWSEFV